jgi:alpha-L-fucosidase 2
MKLNTLLATLSIFSCGTLFAQETIVSDTTPPAHSEIIWSSKPANDWFAAMPIGNGRLGAMIHGRVLNELIQLNDDTLWSGEPRDYQRPGNHKVLPEIRKLLFEEKSAEAQKKINATMLGQWNESYMPLGDISIRIPQQGATTVRDYRRELDLKSGLVKIAYSIDGIRFERESFANFPDKVLVFRIRSDQAKKVALDISLSSQLRNAALKGIPANRIVLVGNAPIRVEPNYQGKRAPKYADGKGMKFVAALHVEADGGTVEKTPDGSLKIRDASVVCLYFSASTSYKTPWTNPAATEEGTAGLVKQNLAVLDNAVQKSYPQLFKAHLADYQALYDRVKINIPPTKAASLPMEERVLKYTAASDPQWASLYYQFGRYLLISGSRPGTQPMNLQGIWNKDLQPPWSANWTMNCNAEINYWGVEAANLSELHEPFIRLTKEISVDGTKTAKNLYNARGWVTHHNIDIWRTTWPVGGTGLWAIYQVGGAWACHSAYNHYLFTGDKKYLAEIYPFLKGASNFYLDTLQEDKNGYLATSPTSSFENHYRKPNGFVGWATNGAIQDVQIVRSLLRNTQEAAKILGRDAEFQSELGKTLNRLAPNKVSPKHGDLQEWTEDWYPAQMNGQVAHAWALNPDWDISPLTTPKLAAALRKTMEVRKPWEKENCASWVGSMAAGNWARLFDGKMVETVLNRHVQKSVVPSLFSVFHQGGGSLQNDGNLGMMSAIGETLLQSRPGEVPDIHILPALLPSWKTGSISGLCARGGFTVDITWTTETVVATIKSTWGTRFRVRFGSNVEEIALPIGGSKTLQWKVAHP